jgi:integrase
VDGDYAILMLLARFGLRTSEVVRLELEDVDWELGQITVIQLGVYDGDNEQDNERSKRSSRNTSKG